MFHPKPSFFLNSLFETGAQQPWNKRTVFLSDIEIIPSLSQICNLNFT